MHISPSTEQDSDADVSGTQSWVIVLVRDFLLIFSGQPSRDHVREYDAEVLFE